MKNRMINKNFWRDEKVGRLSFMERILFAGLWAAAEDTGVGRANPMLLKADVFPYDDLSAQDIQTGLNHMAKLDLIVLYEQDDQVYYFSKNFKRYQSIARPTPSVLPLPTDENVVQCICSEDTVKIQCINSEDTVNEQCECTANIKEYKLKENKRKENKRIYKPGADDVTPDKMTISLSLNTNEEFPIFENQIKEWQELYPAVDVMQELREMKAWCNANKNKRKTKNGIMRFINNWLSKEQDKGGKTIDRQQTKAKQQLVKSKPFVDLNPDNDDDFLSKLEEALVDPWEAFQ